MTMVIPLMQQTPSPTLPSVDGPSKAAEGTEAEGFLSFMMEDDPDALPTQLPEGDDIAVADDPDLALSTNGAGEGDVALVAGESSLPMPVASDAGKAGTQGDDGAQIQTAFVSRRAVVEPPITESKPAVVSAPDATPPIKGTPPAQAGDHPQLAKPVGSLQLQPPAGPSGAGTPPDRAEVVLPVMARPGGDPQATTRASNVTLPDAVPSHAAATDAVTKAEGFPFPRPGKDAAPERGWGQSDTVARPETAAPATPGAAAPQQGLAVASGNPLPAFQSGRGLLASGDAIDRELSLSPADEALNMPRSTIQPLATTGAATVSAPAVPQHIAQQLAKAVVQRSGSVTEVALNPPELGRVRLQVSMQDSALVLIVQAERPETLDLMRRHIDLLTQEFAAMGYGDMQFAFDGRESGQSDMPDAPAFAADLAEPENANDNAALHVGGTGMPADGSLDLRL